MRKQIIIAAALCVVATGMMHHAGKLVGQLGGYSRCSRLDEDTHSYCTEYEYMPSAVTDVQALDEVMSLEELHGAR